MVWEQRGDPKATKPKEKSKERQKAKGTGAKMCTRDWSKAGGKDGTGQSSAVWRWEGRRWLLALGNG